MYKNVHRAGEPLPDMSDARVFFDDEAGSVEVWHADTDETVLFVRGTVPVLP